MCQHMCMCEREGGGQRSLSADVKFPSSDLADNLNNFKQASLGNHWFTEQTGSTSASLLVERGACAPTEIQFLSCTGGLHFGWKWVW